MVAPQPFLKAFRDILHSSQAVHHPHFYRCERRSEQVLCAGLWSLHPPSILESCWRQAGQIRYRDVLIKIKRWSVRYSLHGACRKRVHGGHARDQTAIIDDDIEFKMEAEERDRLTQHSVALRGELKIWEKEFFAANSRKPSREEIKENHSIGTIPPMTSFNGSI